MNILLHLSFLTIFIYLIYIVSKYGIQHSISETYYTIGKKWWFTLIIWGWMFPLIVAGLEVIDSPFIFLGGAAIVFVGAAPAFKLEKSLERTVHMVSSYLGVGFVIFSVVFDFNHVIIGVTYALLILLLMTNIIKLKNRIWWIEISAYLLIFLEILNYEF